MQPLAYVTRGDIIECIHYGAVAVCDASGKLLAAAGDPSLVIYWRSAAKPIQALTMVHSGAADHFGFTAKEISVCCASHHGSADHVATVASILNKIGLNQEALQCGTHWPGDAAESRRLIMAGLEPSPLHNNCSGKHAGMLAACVAMGADPADYLDIHHPAQQSILHDMSALSGVPAESIIIGVDGCGAPVHGMPLQNMATAFARLCAPDHMPERIAMAAPRVIAAMAAEPGMVSAPGSFNSDLLEAFEGRIVAKGGAEGLFVFGLTEFGVGAAVRVIDGGARAHPPIVMEVLRRLGMLKGGAPEALDRYLRLENINCRGQAVGQIKAAEFDLSPL